jgi:hypothetical protein
MAEGRLWATHFFWRHRVVELIYVADQWAWSPLSAWVALVTYDSKPLTALDMSRMNPGTVYERSSLHILGSISCGEPGSGSLI